MEHMTFWQQLTMAVAHQIGSIITSIVGLTIAYWKLKGHVTKAVNGGIKKHE
jgi:hypothetical protein